MDKNVLNKYKNTEEKLILSKILDKINFCENKNKLQITDFLDLSKQEMIKNFLISQKQKNYIFYGGYGEAERKLIIFYPEKLSNLVQEEKINFDEYIKIIRIILPNENKGKYQHQNYLGGLMKLGIKREKVGDILVEKDGADIIIHKDIFKFLQNNLTELTRFQKAKIEEISLKDLRKVVIVKEQIVINVSSMRLDNIIAELAKCSRSKAKDLLENERVLVNYEMTKKSTKEIRENDRITIRGKGRFYIKEIVGNTRKGNIILQVEK